MKPWGEKRPVLHHWGIDSLSKKWVKQKTWGGTLTENICQAISRDLMAAAMIRIEETGLWDIVLSVHDELVAERNIGETWPWAVEPLTSDDFCNLMAELPSWAENLPIKVEGFSSARYCK